MTGAMLTPPAPGNLTGPNKGAGYQLSASSANSLRLAAVAERLASILQSGHDHRNDAVEFGRLCISLARGIDYAVANNDVPDIAQDLPPLLKQICQHRNHLVLQAAVMVLMFSVKSACKIGWFSGKETEELFTLSNAISNSFCSVGDIKTGLNTSTITTIMDRFYPQMKMGQILASLEVKPGYGVFMIDFHIAKSTEHSPLQKIRLFVAQTDNIETSACLTTPPQVNFLLNGKGVDRRTNVFTNTGPQMPTNVTAMLKYGTNLLQAVGQFNGHYIIIVAFMSLTSLLDSSVLQSYVQPAIAAVDSDSDIIEGPSRISLNCPISYARIKVPVKGHSCKHFQCFDFNNYVDMNSRRPSWRCPHCNQHVCYSDIGVDQNMLTVLKEVGENVSEVIISADGSWNAVLESDDHVEQAQDKILDCQKERPDQQDSTLLADANILDLTENDDVNMMDAMITETEDRKPLGANLNQSVPAYSTPSSEMNINGVNQNVAPLIEDDFWSGFDFNPGSVIPGVNLDSQIIGGFSDSNTSNFVPSPPSTDAISPAFNQEVPPMHGQFYAQNSLPLQQLQSVNSIISNEFERLLSLPVQVTRIPVAAQALPAWSQPLGQQQRPRTSLTSSTTNSFPTQIGQSIVPLQDGSSAVQSDIERRRHFSRHHVNPLQVSDLAAASLQHQSMALNRDPQGRFHPGQSAHQVIGPSPSAQVSGAHRVSSASLSNLQNSHLQQALNSRTSQSQLPRTQTQVRGIQGGVVQAASAINRLHPRSTLPSQPASHTMLRQTSSIPVWNQVGEQRGNAGGMAQKVPRADGSVDVPLEQNWRPTGRMRGSLSGQAYSEALNQFIIRPTQPAGTGTPSNLTSLPANVSTQLQSLVDNSRRAHLP